MEATDLVLSRALAYLALMLVAGLPLYRLTVRPRSPVPVHLRQSLAVLALLACGASVWWTLASVAAMMGTSPSGLDREAVTVVLAATPLGTVMAWRLSALVVVVFATVLRFGSARLPLLAMAGVIALGTMAWTGHAGASEGGLGAVHRLADVTHLLAAATWIGALATFARHAFTKRGADCSMELAAFARTGSVIVALLVLTGAINSLAIAGWPQDLARLTVRWFLLLGFKLILFTGMLGFAALNRWYITPALEHGDASALPYLRRSILAEFTLGIAVIGVVAILGLLDPAA